MAAELPLLRATHLSKCYRLYARPGDRFKELLFGGQRHQEFWALRDVNITLRRGASVGVLGENGAGKSTFLKLIAGVLSPTSGTITVYGRVASIIELGMGFHSELSGRENLFIGSALMGVSRKETEARMPAIEAFSELGDFLDRPVRTYSTGMAMRLAFSLAVNVDPELLIVDEALAVGDGYFQKKCIDRIRTFQENGGSLLLCSHSLYQVSLLCQEALWLRDGCVEMYGPTVQIVSAYETYLQTKGEHLPEQHWRELRLGGEIEAVWLEGGRQNGARLLLTRGEELKVHIQWKSDSPQRPFHLGIAIDRVDNISCFATSTLKDRLEPFVGRTSYKVLARFPDLQLSNGSFRVIVFLFDEHGVHIYYQKIAEQIFTIAVEEKEWGIFYLTHTWEASW
jgi:lipopolysaccharide transport system ATP-binding protein